VARGTFRIVDGLGWIGDRSLPEARIHIGESDSMPAPDSVSPPDGFKLRERGMHIDVCDGNVLSVAWGSDAFCDNYYIHDRPFEEASPTAEVCLFNEKDEWLFWCDSEDALLCYVDVPTALEIIDGLDAGRWPEGEVRAYAAVQ
jgi:hypothetical protein